MQNYFNSIYLSLMLYSVTNQNSHFDSKLKQSHKPLQFTIFDTTIL